MTLLVLCHLLHLLSVVQLFLLVFICHPIGNLNAVVRPQPLRHVEQGQRDDDYLERASIICKYGVLSGGNGRHRLDIQELRDEQPTNEHRESIHVVGKRADVVRCTARHGIQSHSDRVSEWHRVNRTRTTTCIFSIPRLETRRESVLKQRSRLVLADISPYSTTEVNGRTKAGGNRASPAFRARSLELKTALKVLMDTNQMMQLFASRC